jgi:hypothetical protein
MMKVIVAFQAFISKWETPTWPPSIQMEVTAGIFLASILLNEMRYLVYIRYLWSVLLNFNEPILKPEYL